MRTLIFALTLIAASAFGAPQPTPFLNAWTTNKSVLPVFGDNNLAVSNRIAGAGGGTSWNFYGISPNTVARLKDATNIANAIVTNAIASSNANYVLKFNGPSDGQVATNLTVVNQTRFDISSGFLDANANNFLTWDGNLVNLVLGPDYGLVRVVPAQTNSSTLDVLGDFTAYGKLIAGGSAIYFRQIGDTDDPNTPYPMFELSPGDDLKIGVHSVSAEHETTDVRLYAQLHQLHWNGAFLTADDTGGAILGNPTMPWQLYGTYIQNAFHLTNGGGFTNGGPVVLMQTSASKLLKTDANNVVTNSVYSDADIAALQAATNANTAAINSKQNGTATLTNWNALGVTNFNPNQFAASGGTVSLTNNFTGTNGQLISATNSPSASNQVAVTIQGLVGQNTNVFVVNPTGGVVTAGSPVVISGAGNVGI